MSLKQQLCNIYYRDIVASEMELLKMDKIIQCPNCCSAIQNENLECQECGYVLDEYDDQSQELLERIAEHVYAEKNM